MIENRYQNSLREKNQLILNLTPANSVLRIELSLELKKRIKNYKKPKILEIGIGEGDLTKFILENNNNIQIDCLDISKEMIELSKTSLDKYNERINFIQSDVLVFLEKLKSKYDVIVSAWTIHNFEWENKKLVFQNIFNSLSQNGTFLLMDKVYPDNKNNQIKLQEKQLQRYDYLEKSLRNDIINHEKQDIIDKFRMEETKTIDFLNSIGFKKIKVLDRIERDVLLIARKS